MKKKLTILFSFLLSSCGSGPVDRPDPSICLTALSSSSIEIQFRDAQDQSVLCPVASDITVLSNGLELDSSEYVIRIEDTCVATIYNFMEAHQELKVAVELEGYDPMDSQGVETMFSTCARSFPVVEIQMDLEPKNDEVTD